MRGNLHPNLTARYLQWSIPACAGEPAAGAADATSPRVYPRVCGGTPCCVVRMDIARGLSPRVRGNLSQAVSGQARPGSIPACAGEPPVPPAHKCDMQVYPRVCGGTCAINHPSSKRRGLSPRVRGNLGKGVLYEQGGRSIPACAGEPFTEELTEVSFGVYPRVCGGTRGASRGRSIWGGLSPRVRGNRAPALPQRSLAGSIPACAGEPPG